MPALGSRATTRCWVVLARGSGLHAGTDSSCTLETLRDRLLRLEYPALLKVHARDLVARGQADRLRRSLHGNLGPLGCAVRLFYLREEVPRGEVIDAFGSELIATLLRQDVLREEARSGGLRTPYRIEVLSDTFLLTERHEESATAVYFDEDSRFLRHMLEPRAGDLCLDFCTGTGIQGLRCAQVAERVDAVDLNPRAVKVARLNAALNGLSERYRVFEGDLDEALPLGAEYDYVISNPPLIPVDDAVPYPLCGHGGPDGLEIVGKILRSVAKRLRGGGRGAVIGACTGDAKRAHVLPLAERVLGAEFEIVLFQMLRTTLRDWVGLVAQTVPNFYPAISYDEVVLRSRQGYGAALDESFVFTYLLKFKRSGRSDQRLIDLSQSGRQRSFWFVEPAGGA